MIDWTQIEALRGDVGDGFANLVEVFLDEMDSAITRLDPHATPPQMEAHLHFLKGSALNLGFADFAALCAEGEARAGQGGAVDVGPIRQLYLDSRSVFMAGLSDRRAA